MVGIVPVGPMAFIARRAAGISTVTGVEEVVSPVLVVTSLIIPDQKTSDGILIKSTSLIWAEIAKEFAKDFSRAMQLTPAQWEEMIAGAYAKEGYSVILTPRSGDFGRDVIATRSGVGSVKILGSVKAYKPDHLVDAEAVRSLIGVVSADRQASKGIITTTSDFAPKITEDPSIAPFIPTRIELMNGKAIQSWLADLTKM